MRSRRVIVVYLAQVLSFDISGFRRSHHVVHVRARFFCLSLDELFGITREPGNEEQIKRMRFKPFKSFNRYAPFKSLNSPSLFQPFQSFR
jgi:hypothetical protein